MQINSRADLVALQEVSQQMAARIKEGHATQADLIQFTEMRAAFELYQSKSLGPVQAVRELMKKNFIGPEEYQQVFGQQVLPVRLPKNILKILMSDCPIYGDGKKVFQTHKLTLVPMKIGEDSWSLRKLYELVGGQAGKVLWSNAFIGHPFGEQTLAGLPRFDLKTQRNGKYILWCDKVPEVTKNKNWEDSRAKLREVFGTTHRPANALEFASGLILHERVTGERLYANEWGWCEDYLPNGYDGSGSAAALFVGDFSSGGLSVLGAHPAHASDWRGCSALWIF